MTMLDDSKAGGDGSDGRDASATGAAADATTTAAAGQDAGDAPRPRPAEAPARASLITAVEIENFKGISRRVRIDLRPITLLFGRNSAGKSTVLQALCYAHHVLSGGDVDAHRLALGGDQIDLGGFRRFVHGRDLERVVRLRFELNLEDWSIPGWLVQEISNTNDLPGMAEAAGVPDAVQIEEWAPNCFAKSGWVALAVRWQRSKPVVDSYEVGVNGLLLGRLVAGRPDVGGPVRLAYNAAHPLFDGLCRVGEQGDPTGTHDELPQADVRNLASPLPKRAMLDPDMTGANLFQDVLSAITFRARLSGMLVGIGDTLRGALAAARYIGPVRRLRPPAGDTPSVSALGDWSDGSAAWNRLVRDAVAAPTPSARRLIDDVNDWLARPERLDTGYRLHRHQTVELPANDGPVAVIRDLQALPVLRNPQGEVDVEVGLRCWAEAATANTTVNPGVLEGAMRRVMAQFAPTGDTASQLRDAASQLREGDLDAQMSAGLRVVAILLTAQRQLEEGGDAVRDLIRRIAEAPLRRTLELVTADTGLPVRTPEIGVGISQLLPVVVAALDPDRPGITAIEQPELHAHPKLQVELGDLFAQSAGDGRVFLLENHSEHMMLRLLRRIEETTDGELPEGKPALQPDQVSVMYLYAIGGAIHAKRLRIDETGEFVDRWPQGFFDERADELFPPPPAATRGAS